MKHYMQYHNAEKMGHGCAGIEEEPLSIVTQKSVPDIKGEVVWILCGEGKPRRYGLCARFVVTNIEAEPGGKTIVSGEGTLLKREIPLNDEPWFKGFLESYQNFSLGFRELKQREYIEHFERLLAAESAGEGKAPRGSSGPAESKQSPRAAKEAKTPQPGPARALPPVESSAREEKSPGREGSVGSALVEPLELFIAYSDKDEGLRESLEQSLITMARSGQIKIWHDGKIAAGADRKKEIGENLSRAKIILLLLSSDFLASEYNDVELQEALKRRDADEAVFIPIILRPCQWQNSQLGRLQALPKNGKPVTKWSNKDEAFLHIVQEISRAIDKQRGGSRTA